MAQTVITGKQVKDASIQRNDLDTSTVGSAVVAKIVQGTNVTLSSTGGDAGTGDVTINVPTLQTGKPAYTNTSAGFTVPSIGSTVVVNVNDTSWATVGEIVWVAGAAGSGIAATMKITALTGTTLTLQT